MNMESIWTECMINYWFSTLFILFRHLIPSFTLISSFIPVGTILDSVADYPFLYINIYFFFLSDNNMC